MMRVTEVFDIIGRGRVALVVLDGELPALGSHLLRESDGARFRVKAVERWGKAVGDLGTPGQSIGLLLHSDVTEAFEGDQFLREEPLLRAARLVIRDEERDAVVEWIREHQDAWSAEGDATAWVSSVGDAIASGQHRLPRGDPRRDKLT